MNRDSVIDYLRGLTAKQFAELFYESTQGRHPWPGEKELSEARPVLAYATREKDESGAEWELRIVCPVPDVRWVDDAPLCQSGNHCGFDTISWAKQSVCPICGARGSGT